MKRNELEASYRERAIEAYQLFNNMKEMLRESKENDEKEIALERKEEHLRALCRGLPVLIHNNGLVMTLLFLGRKKEEKNSIEWQLYDGILQRLQYYYFLWEEEKNIILFMQQNWKICRILTREAIEFSIWLSRFAEN